MSGERRNQQASKQGRRRISKETDFNRKKSLEKKYTQASEKKELLSEVGRITSRKMDVGIEADRTDRVKEGSPNERVWRTDLSQLRKALEKGDRKGDKNAEQVGRDKATRELAGAIAETCTDPIQKKWYRAISNGLNPREYGMGHGKFLTDSTVESVARMAGSGKASEQRIFDALQKGERPQLPDLRKEVGTSLDRIWRREDIATMDRIKSNLQPDAMKTMESDRTSSDDRKPEIRIIEKGNQFRFTREDWERFLDQEESKVQKKIPIARPSDVIISETLPGRVDDVIISKSVSAEFKRQMDAPSLSLEEYLKGELSNSQRAMNGMELNKTPRSSSGERSLLPETVEKGPLPPLTKAELEGKRRAEPLESDQKHSSSTLEESLKRDKSKLSFRPDDFMPRDVSPSIKEGEFSALIDPELSIDLEKHAKELENELFKKLYHLTNQDIKEKSSPIRRRRPRTVSRLELDEHKVVLPSEKKVEVPQRRSVMRGIVGIREQEKALEDVKQGPFAWLARRNESKTLILPGQKIIIRDNTEKVVEKSLDVWRGNEGTDRPSTNAPRGETFVVDRENRVWYSARTGKAVARSPHRDGLSVSQVILEGMVTGEKVYDIFLPHHDRTPHRRLALTEIVGSERFIIVRAPHERDMMPMEAERTTKLSMVITLSAHYMRGAAKDIVHNMLKKPIQTALMLLLEKGQEKIGLPVTRYLFGSQAAQRLGDAVAMAAVAETPDEIHLAARILADELAGWAVGQAMGKVIKGTVKGAKRTISATMLRRAEARMKVYGPDFQYFKNKYFNGDAVTAEKVLMGKGYKGDIKFAIQSQEYRHRLINHIKKGRPFTSETHQKLNEQAKQRVIDLETPEYKETSNIVNKMEVEKPGLKMRRGKNNPLRQHLYGDPAHAKDFAQINGVETEYKKLTDFEQHRISTHNKTEVENLEGKSLDNILDELARRRVTERLENKGKVIKEISDNLIRKEKKRLRKVFKKEGQKEGRDTLTSELAQRRAQDKAFLETSKLYNEMIRDIATKALARSDTVLYKADYHGHPDFGGKNLGSQWNLEYTTRDGKRALITWTEDGQILNTLDIKTKGTIVGKKKDGTPLRVPDPRHTFQNRQYEQGNDESWLKNRGEKP